MNSWKRDLGSGRRLVAMFLGVAVLLAGALLWVGWRLARQDRELAAGRLQEIGADLAVAALQKSVAQAEGQLAALAALPLPELRKKAAASAESLPADSALILIHGAELESYPENRLPFYPDVSIPSAPLDPSFAAAEALEFRQPPDYPGALAALRSLASSQRSEVRATALLHVARIHRKQSQWEEALAAYREMSALKGVAVQGLGVPADLVAGQSRSVVFEQQQRRDAARVEAGALLDGLRHHRWRLTRGAYEFYEGDARRILGIPAPDADPAGQLVLAGAVESLYGERRDEGGPSGRRIVSRSGGSVLALWRGLDGNAVAMILGARWVEAQWASTLRPSFAAGDIALGLTDSEGRSVLGPEAVRAPRSTVRPFSATQLPWNLHAVIGGSAGALTSSHLRERLLLAGMVAVALLIVAGAYLVGRAVSRELAVSRQQSDFVSAVSHEFRTPLTSLCLLTEHLASGRISGEKDRAGYYEVLMSESRRLRRLVEGLLNFGRMEAGTAEYRFETIDPAELVQEVSRQLERDAGTEGRRIEVRVNEDAPLVRADRAALACVVWNLLDNALKYSPGCAAVWADVGRDNGRAAIRVRDLGIGIPPSEQARIFEKFMRGEAAKQAGIRGTGVGLAMVRHIVAAHQGEVRLESKPGEGSTFTLLLPAAN